MDPFEHPDLVEVGRRMRERLERVLAAESAAAAAISRSATTLRDLLCDLENRGARTTVTTSSGTRITGVVTLVGANFVELDLGARAAAVPLSHIECVAFACR